MKSKKSEKTKEIERLREQRNLAHTQLQLQISQSKVQWDAALNPFIAVSEYCTPAARAHRVKVYTKFIKAAIALAAAEKTPKKEETV